jgi:gamma-glutamyltranspeptidase / glutathione hydrolase
MRRCVLGVVLLASCGERPDGPPPGPPMPCQALTEEGGGVTVGSGHAGDPAAPRPATAYASGRSVVRAHSYMVVTANPLASRAGCEVLEAGGTAVDAAIAAQLVLGLVEPQASGIGGGAFLLHYDAATQIVQAYDGRETAPAGATEDYLRTIDGSAGSPAPQPSARASGRSIGTPGVLRMLALAYQDHGRRAWPALFTPAIELARDGFAVSGRLALAIAEQRASLLGDAEATATYFDAGRPLAVGAMLKVPAYAATLSALAAGVDAFYTGELAQAIVDQVQRAQAADGTPITPGATTLADLAGYQAVRRDAVCTPYRQHQICGMPPPSSGGIAVAETLGVLAQFDLGALAPIGVDREGGTPQVAGVHLVAEAERLAYADRDAYVADPDFVPLPGGSSDALLAPAYLTARGSLIQPTSSLGTAPPGDFGAAGVAHTPEHGTSQITIVDAEGNVVTMTTTIESPFGSYHMTHGFLLNNQLTDFSVAAADAGGVAIANRVAPGKRPRSSMAPTLVFDLAADGAPGRFVMATGSPGGATIIQYVVKTLVGALDWGLDAQQATALVDFGAANDPTTNVGGEHPDASDDLVRGLQALGHTVNRGPQSSGLATILRDPSGELRGGADPRRDGLVLGDLQP